MDCYIENDFYCEKNILNMKENCENKAFSLDLDKRSTRVSHLKQLLITRCTDIDDTRSKLGDEYMDEMRRREQICLNTLFDESASAFCWMLAQRVDTSASGSSGRFSYYIKALLEKSSENLSQLISSCNKANKTILILCKHADKWPIGDQYEPVRLVARFYDRAFTIHEVSFTFAKCTLLKQVKEEIGKMLLAELNHNLGEGAACEPVDLSTLVFNLVTPKSKKSNDKLTLEASACDHKTLAEMGIRHEDIIVVESPADNENMFKGNEANANNLLASASATSSLTKAILESGEIKVSIFNLVIRHDELSKADFTPKEIKVEGWFVLALIF